MVTLLRRWSTKRNSKKILAGQQTFQIHDGDLFLVKSFSVVEWDDDEVNEMTLKLDGSDNKSTGF